MSRSESRANQGFDRRTVLKLGGGGLLAALAAPALVGCGGSKSGSDAAATNASTNVKLPTYKAQTSVPTPDLAGNGSFIEPGYLTFPKELATSIPEKPGKGNKYTASVMVYGPPAAANNPQIAAVNEAMGSSIVYQQIPADQYNTKTTAMLAGGQVPDIFTVPSWDIPARLGDGAKRAFADLTDKLAGDAVSKYPNLANLPTAAWAGAAINGTIAAVPVPAPLISWATFARTDLVEEAGAKPPTSVAEMLEVSKQVTNAAKRRWAWWDPDQFVRRAYGLSNGWNADDSGTMRYYWEMPAWKDALALYQQLYKSGYMHPDALSGSGDKKASFVSGQVVFVDDGFDAWKDWSSPAAAKTNNTKFKVDPLVPFAADGGAATVWCEYPWLMLTFLNKKLSSDQIDEVLGLLNYIAAPFGTKENMLITMGIEGRHYTMKDGVPVATAKAADELRSQYYFTAQAPRVLTNYSEPDWVKRAHAWEASVSPMAKMTKGAGLYVDIPAKLQAYRTKPLDATKDVVRGRMSNSDFDKVIAAWQKQYGDALRKLYQAAVDASA